MTQEAKDYFASPDHELKLRHFTEEERQRLIRVMQSEGIYTGLSLCIAVLSFYMLALRRLGLSSVVERAFELHMKDAKSENEVSTSSV